MAHLITKQSEESEVEAARTSLNFSRFSSRFHGMADEELVLLARQGTLEVVEFILSRYRSLVEHKARAYYLMGADRDDVIQEGMIGLCKAIRDFREERLSKFRPFAELCITRQIITAIKTATRHKHVPLNASISLHQSLSEDQSEGSLIDIIPDKNAESQNEYLHSLCPQKNLFDLVKNALSDLERDVLQCYLDGKTYIEISHELKCQTKAIDNALQRAKRKIGSLMTQDSNTGQSPQLIAAH